MLYGKEKEKETYLHVGNSECYEDIQYRKTDRINFEAKKDRSRDH